MRLLIAALAALWMTAPASAAQHSDDRYFDSRAYAAPAKVKVRKAVRHVRKVVSRRRSLPHDKLTLTSADEQLLIRRETIQYDEKLRRRRETINYIPNINSSATFPAIAKAVVLGGRPAGCPARFCGCGASLEVFGRIIPFLNLAANWLRFPRAEPAPGMAAARRGHVFVLKRHIAGKTWLVHDSNSGRRLTRLHPRSIAGYTIVNPRAGPS